MTKEERIQQAYEVYEQQLNAVDKQAVEAREFHKQNLKSVLKTIRDQVLAKATAKENES